MKILKFHIHDSQTFKLTNFLVVIIFYIQEFHFVNHQESYERTKKLLLKNKSLLNKMALRLVEKETMSALEVKKLLNLDLN